MVEEVIDRPPEQLPIIEEVSSPLCDDQIFQLCDSEFIQETLQNSEVTSCSNFCQEQNINTCNNLSLPDDPNNHGAVIYTATTTTTATSTTTNSNNPSLTFDGGQDDIDNNDISASIDFSSSPGPTSPFMMPPVFATQQPDHIDLISSTATAQISLTNAGVYADSSDHVVAPLMLTGPAFSSVTFDEDCLSNTIPQTTSYMSLNPGIVGSSTASYLSGNLNAALSGPDGSGIFMGNLLMNSDIQTQELDYQADNSGIYCPTDSMSCLFNPTNMQAFCSDSQNLVGHVNTTPLAAEISSLEESSYKVGKLSVEQRKEKIHRYMKKRNERNFSKKIKYACRKTLADSRPRVRGRFAKNDDFGETIRSVACSSHEEDDKDDVDVKEEQDMLDSLDSSEIFAHISGVNSFKCNFPAIQSWI